MSHFDCSSESVEPFAEIEEVHYCSKSVTLFRGRQYRDQQSISRASVPEQIACFSRVISTNASSHICSLRSYAIALQPVRYGKLQKKASQLQYWYGSIFIVILSNYRNCHLILKTSHGIRKLLSSSLSWLVLVLSPSQMFVLRAVSCQKFLVHHLDRFNQFVSYVAQVILRACSTSTNEKLSSSLEEQLISTLLSTLTIFSLSTTEFPYGLILPSKVMFQQLDGCTELVLLKTIEKQ